MPQQPLKSSMKIKIDASEFGNKNPTLYGTDSDLALYYDETNNVRKLRLTESGLNVAKHDNFVLGGIVLKPGQSAGDIEELRKLLWIQKTAPEIKFDLVAKGDFEKVLDSSKLNKVFAWLVERGIGVHYVNVNILNWFILDIVESLVADERFEDFLPFHREIKNEFHRIAIADLPSFLTLLRRYSFPDIDRSKTNEFMDEIRAVVQRHWPVRPNRATLMLSDLFSRARSLPQLAFLVDETPNELIDGFSDFFIDRICTFKNARHVLDEEYEIQDAIEKFQLMNGDREVDFSFVDSKSVAEVQLSDVVVGFLGKYFTFIEKTPMPVLLRKRKALSRTQASTLKLLEAMIDISDETSNGLLHRLTTLDSDWKSDSFLFGRAPPPHLLDE